ncbi:MAG: DUF4328 domain-containing protein [Clostridia bacterium]|nr:DUF4328 domain-containing protein [Clostridia bacterium]
MIESDEDLYLKASQEVENGTQQAALWAKALTVERGDKEKAKYSYIEMRVERLKSEAGGLDGEEEKALFLENDRPMEDLSSSIAINEQSCSTELIEKKKTPFLLVLELDTASNWVKYSCIFLLIMATLSLFLQVREFFLLGRIASIGISEAEFHDFFVRLSLIGMIVSSLSFFISLLVWVYKASKNSHGFGSQGMRYSPSMALCWFFVPVANLVMPVLVLREIFKVSQNPMEWKGQKSTILLIAWGVVHACNWLMVHLVRSMDQQKGLETIADLKSFTLLKIVGLTGVVIYVILSWVIVKKITNNQRQLVNLA